MSRRPDGREVFARLAYPLPVAVFAELAQAIEQAAERIGYTDVALDIYDQGAITATPPAEARTDGGS